MVVQVLHSQMECGQDPQEGATNPSSPQIPHRTRFPENFFKEPPELGKEPPCLANTISLQFLPTPHSASGSEPVLLFLQEHFSPSPSTFSSPFGVSVGETDFWSLCVERAGAQSPVGK